MGNASSFFAPNDCLDGLKKIANNLRQDSLFRTENWALDMKDNKHSENGIILTCWKHFFLRNKARGWQLKNIKADVTELSQFWTLPIVQFFI